MLAKELVHHDRQADDIGAGSEIAKGAELAYPGRLWRSLLECKPHRLDTSLSDYGAVHVRKQDRLAPPGRGLHPEVGLPCLQFLPDLPEVSRHRSQ